MEVRSAIEHVLHTYMLFSLNNNSWNYVSQVIQAVLGPSFIKTCNAIKYGVLRSNTADQMQDFPYMSLLVACLFVSLSL